jgi:hypothetical protein
MKELMNPLVKIGQLGAIAATLPLTALAIASPSWANEILTPSSTVTLEVVAGEDGGVMSSAQPVAIKAAAEAVTAEQAAVEQANDLCPDQPCPPISTVASDLAPLPTAPVESAIPPALAQTSAVEPAPAAESTGDLAAAAQNPIANLISVPFQNNTNFGVGPDDRTQNILNIQPVVPVPLSDDLLLVTRTILPIVLQPDARGSGSIFGLGDLNPTFFFVPVTASNFTWGVGPTLVLPTATDRQTGTGKWSAGPAGVAVVNSGQWVYGGLASQVWSFAGDDSRANLSQLVLQPFVTYNLPSGWYITSSPIITANWNASSGDQWTVPIGGGFGRVFAVGTQPLNTSLQLYWNAARPTNGADFSLRAAVQLLFPR